MTIDVRTLRAFLDDDRILERVKVEDYLPVVLGSRPSSSFMIPAEMPSGEDIRRGIDESYSRKYYSGGGRRGLLGFVDRTRFNLQRLVSTPLVFRAGLIRSAFTEVVYDHEEYRAHRQWAERLNLDTYQKELRPSLDDLFLASSEETMDRVSRVMGMRDRIRHEARERQDLSPVFLPEELSPLFLDAMGLLLGYPKCCTNAYIADTERGLDSGMRASEQLEEFEDSPDPSAYFARYFYPCEPRCAEAIELGSRIIADLEALSTGLGETSARQQRLNLEFVGEYRDFVRRQQEEMVARMEEAGTDDLEQE